VVAFVVVLGGCSSADPPEQPEESAAVARVPTPAPATDPAATADPRSALSDLAAAAEEAAKAAGAATAVPPTGAQEQVLGADISWPQCPVGLGIPEKRTLGLPPPRPSARFVVIGLTNGPGFVANPCLADQVAQARQRELLTSAYSVISYPDAATVDEHGSRGPYDEGTASGVLHNTGYAQARYNIESMVRTGLETPVVWLDVEPVPSFDWSADPEANAAVVEGAARGYTDAGYRVGVYSTPALWSRIVGDLRLGGAPEWRPAGPTSREAAEVRCGPGWSIQGGPAVLVQWVEGNRDLDVTCPAMPGALDTWFHRW
jgi:hypothetical protein